MTFLDENNAYLDYVNDEINTRGAQEILDLAKKLNIKKAILKARSPSYGCGLINEKSG